MRLVDHIELAAATGLKCVPGKRQKLVEACRKLVRAADARAVAGAGARANDSVWVMVLAHVSGADMRSVALVSKRFAALARRVVVNETVYDGRPWRTRKLVFGKNGYPEMCVRGSRQYRLDEAFERKLFGCVLVAVDLGGNPRHVTDRTCRAIAESRVVEVRLGDAHRVTDMGVACLAKVKRLTLGWCQHTTENAVKTLARLTELVATRAYVLPRTVRVARIKRATLTDRFVASVMGLERCDVLGLQECCFGNVAAADVREMCSRPKAELDIAHARQLEPDATIVVAARKCVVTGVECARIEVAPETKVFVCRTEMKPNVLGLLGNPRAWARADIAWTMMTRHAFRHAFQLVTEMCVAGQREVCDEDCANVPFARSIDVSGCVAVSPRGVARLVARALEMHGPHAVVKVAARNLPKVKAEHAYRLMLTTVRSGGSGGSGVWVDVSARHMPYDPFAFFVGLKFQN